MQNNKNSISVIVPIFNVETYILRCLDSILSQTYSNLQIILIDDGSTDSSGKICDKYAKLDKRVEVYHTKNNGLVAARKLGLDMSIGEYIGFVDADDYIEKNMFSELVQNIVKYNADFVHSGFIEEEKESSILIFDFEETVFSLTNTEDRMNFLCNYIFKYKSITPSIWSKLFKADFIKKCYQNIPNSQQYGEDLICLCRCVLESQKISLCKKTLYHYIVRKDSLSHLKKSKYVEKEISLWHYVLTTLNEYKCSENVKESMYFFFRERVLCVADILKSEEVHITRYYFKNIPWIIGKKIVIYGAGNVGQDYYAQISKYRCCQIVAWIDLHWNKYQFDYTQVVGIEYLSELEFDIVIIAVMNKMVRKEIKEYLLNIGICEQKIIWQKPGYFF